MRELLSHQAEDYLKAIYALSRTGRATTQVLAERLGLSAASVTGMLKKLGELGLVEHTPYQGAVLSKSGERVALELIRHHRLIELYLHQALGMPIDTVHDEAERLEHVISEDFEERIAAVLGQPTHDPHGEPIPAKDGTLPDQATHPLAELAPSERARIGRVAEEDPGFLRFLDREGLLPGALVHVLEVNYEGGTLMLEIAGKTKPLSLSLEAARRLWVEEVLFA